MKKVIRTSKCEKYCVLVDKMIENKFYTEAEREMEKVLLRMQVGPNTHELRECVNCIKNRFELINTLTVRMAS